MINGKIFLGICLLALILVADLSLFLSSGYLFSVSSKSSLQPIKVAQELSEEEQKIIAGRTAVAEGTLVGVDLTSRTIQVQSEDKSQVVTFTVPEEVTLFIQDQGVGEKPSLGLLENELGKEVLVSLRVFPGGDYEVTDVAVVEPLGE